MDIIIFFFSSINMIVSRFSIRIRPLSARCIYLVLLNRDQTVKLTII